MIILIIIIAVLLFLVIKNWLSKRFVLRCFHDGNVCVTGLRGRGKDVLFNYVVRRRAQRYISNVDYGGRHEEFEPANQFSVGGNTCNNFIGGDVIPYTYPYPDGIDYYISDAQLYFPSQEFAMLNNRYRSFPVFQSLSRHLGDCNVHINTQNLNRVWDKIREQSDMYISCQRCTFFFGRIVRLKVIAYDKMQSCIDRVQPFKRRMGKQGRIAYDTLRAQFGNIKPMTLWFIHRGNYDTRRFKKYLENGGVKVE